MSRLRCVLTAVAFVLASRPGQRSSLVVTVVDEVTRRALPNAEVVDVDSRARWFTNDRGEASVPWPSSSRLHLHVRQLGFKPAERTIERMPDDNAADTLTIGLERVAFALPEVVTREATRCGGSADTVAGILSVPALEQLRLGAERYETFRKTFPFRIKQERRTVRLSEDGKQRSVQQITEAVASDRWGEPYVPGEIIRREPLGFSIPILFVSTLADSLFWHRHCFTTPGIQTLNGARVVRLEFAPAFGIDAAEWQGVAFIDSATSILRRVEFNLVGIPDRVSPRRFEGYTTFSSPSPFIAIPDSTVAMWWRDGPRQAPEWGMPDVVQLVHVMEVRYRKSAPP